MNIVVDCTLYMLMEMRIARSLPRTVDLHVVVVDSSATQQIILGWMFRVNHNTCTVYMYK